MLDQQPGRAVLKIIIVLALIHSVIILSSRLLPFIDLPNHLAEAAIYKFYGASGNSFASYYQPTPWFYPNTFHTFFCSVFPTVEIGNRVFFVFYVLLLFASVFLVIDRLKANYWYGLLAVLFLYNYNVTFGFVGYAISIPAITLLFYFILKDFEIDSLLHKVIISTLLVLIFFMHAQNALFALLLFGLLTLVRFRKSLRHLLARGVLIPLPLVMFIVGWWASRGNEKEESTSGYLFQYYVNDYLKSMTVRARLIVFDNFQLFEGWFGLIVAAFFFACVIAPLIVFRKQIKRRFTVDNDLVSVGILLCASLACYMLLPDKLPGQSPLSQRFCTLTILALILVGAKLLSDVRSQQMNACVVVVVSIYSIFWFQYLNSFNRENSDFRPAFFSNIDGSSRLAGLIYDNKFRGRKVYIHYPNYFLVWNNGIVASKIIDYRFGIVRRVANENVIPFYHELIGEHYQRIASYQHLDYLLVRGIAPVNDDVNVAGFELEREAGKWKLYHRLNQITEK